MGREAANRVTINWWYQRHAVQLVLTRVIPRWVSPRQAEPAAKRIKRKLSKTISDATPDEWLQLVQAAQAADPQVRIETLAAYASLCDQMNTALHAYQEPTHRIPSLDCPFRPSAPQ